MARVVLIDEVGDADAAAAALAAHPDVTVERAAALPGATTSSGCSSAPRSRSGEPSWTLCPPCGS